MKKESVHCELMGQGKVRCLLCPHYCLLNKGQTGNCGVRRNEHGRLFSLIYGEATSVALDPIEKKPLYRFHPGTSILSLGTRGCNLKCPWCQNFSIAQNPDCPTQDITSKDIVAQAKRMDSLGVAYTYNEPFIWYEFVYDTARLVHEAGLKNVLVTNGYINQKPLEEIIGLIDAMNIDIKAMDNEFYHKHCKGSLEPVLNTAEYAKDKCHIEITNLIIPTLNDRDDQITRLVNWIAKKLGKDTPLHLSCYFPAHKSQIPTTPIDTLRKAEKIAKRKLQYVYLGNV